MKSLFACASVCLLSLTAHLADAGETRITAPDGRTRAYIDERGRISAPDGKTLGYVEQSGRVSRPDGSTGRTGLPPGTWSYWGARTKPA